VSEGGGNVLRSAAFALGVSGKDPKSSVDELGVFISGDSVLGSQVIALVVAEGWLRTGIMLERGLAIAATISATHPRDRVKRSAL
jgi:hypothetical protein